MQLAWTFHFQPAAAVCCGYIGRAGIRNGRAIRADLSAAILDDCD